MRRRPVSPLRLLLLFMIVTGIAVIGLSLMVNMPGESASTELSELTDHERDTARRLEADVRALAEDIGERNLHHPDAMARAADHVDERFREIGFEPQRQEYELSDALAGHYREPRAENIHVEVTGHERPEEIIIIGAHYDTVPGSPGANDNASAVATLLHLAESFADDPQPRTLRFVAFANEEPPFYMSEDMGSHVHAARAREAGEDIRAMMSMDGLGYFSDEPGSQQFPGPGLGMLYPDRAEFIGFVTRLGDRALLRRAIAAFREEASIPSEGAALPSAIPGVAWSDHWSFWQHGYPAFFVTDTLPFRDPYYHSPGDTPERLDYERMARVAVGLETVVRELGGEDG